jgi:hypothetical protein
MHRSEGATALLGLDGFVAGVQVEEGGEVWIVVEATDGVAGCPARERSVTDGGW